MRKTFHLKLLSMEMQSLIKMTLFNSNVYYNKKSFLFLSCCFDSVFEFISQAKTKKLTLFFYFLKCI